MPPRRLPQALPRAALTRRPRTQGLEHPWDHGHGDHGHGHGDDHGHGHGHEEDDPELAILRKAGKV